MDAKNFKTLGAVVGHTNRIGFVTEEDAQQ
jgi:hypothetical protein